ncbi:cupin domain-containing protein, partial [Streptomyces sp. AB3(2024)]|uniref:cupin domain-containing protein n=1 Tax=Streptomyces sp. AB3(2024) TaxID=3317321 RepID=UPI0035A35CB0
MTTHPDPTGVLADLDAVIAGAPEGATGALWRLTAAARGLDANLIRLRPDAVIAEHAEPALDVLLVVVDGAGRIDTEDGAHRLRPHSAVLLARGARRSLTAGPRGMTYLTVHTRRPGLGIGTAVGAAAGGAG